MAGNIILHNVSLNLDPRNSFTQNDGQSIATDQIKARDGDGLKLYDDGGNGIFVEDGGNVGIGTTGPGEPLHLHAQRKLYLGSNSLNYGWKLYSKDVGAEDTPLYFDQNANAVETTRMVIDKDGNVGIGTINPASALEIVGTTTVDDVEGPTSGLTMRAGWNSGGFAFKTGTGSAWATRMIILQGGNVGIGTTEPTALLDINSDILRLRTAKTPASAGAAGNAGSICWDATYLYICAATNTWRRIAHNTW